MKSVGLSENPTRWTLRSGHLPEFTGFLWDYEVHRMGTMWHRSKDTFEGILQSRSETSTEYLYPSVDQVETS